MAAGIPSFSSQRLMDVSLLSGRNLEELSDKLAMGLMKPDQTPPPEAIAYRNIGRAAYERGSRYYREEKPVMLAFGKLMLWSCAGYLTAYLSLRRRERG